jgi:hypothetical protein
MRPYAAALSHRKGDYGFDAPYVLLVLGAIGVTAVIVGVVIGFAGSTAWAEVSIAVGIYLLMMASSFAFTNASREVRRLGETLGRARPPGR